MVLLQHSSGDSRTFSLTLLYQSKVCVEVMAVVATRMCMIQCEQRALPVLYLLRWWAELHGQVSRSSAELECHWLS